MRGYGLAALAILWACGAIWSFVERPARASFLHALVAAALAAQTHYSNAILLAAMGVGGGLVSLRRRELRTLGALAALLLAAAALLVVVNAAALRHVASTAGSSAGPWGVAFVSRVFLDAPAAGVPLLAALWTSAAVAGAAGLVRTARADASPSDRDWALFIATTAVLSVVATVASLVPTGQPTQYWHYLSQLALVALACEVGVSLLARRTPALRWARVAAVALAAALVVPRVASVVALRMTDVDVAAAAVAADARGDDLVVVLPWQTGIMFRRYYRGVAPWMTVPDFADHRFHAHLDLMAKLAAGADAFAPELARVEATLRSGGRVWIVGRLSAPDPGTPQTPPVFDGRADPVLNYWEARLGALVEVHGATLSAMPLPDVGKVNAWESVPLGMVTGWR